MNKRLKRTLILLSGVYLASVLNLSGDGLIRELEPDPEVSAGAYVDAEVHGLRVWETSNTAKQLYFEVPDDFEWAEGEPVYVRVEYVDAGRGLLFAEYDSTYGSTAGDKHFDAELHTRSSRMGSGTFVYSYQVFESPVFSGRQAGGNDFRIKVRNSDATPFQVASVSISTEVFADERLQYVVTRPWLQAYDGPSKDFVDNQTIVGKVLTGYQGWFKTPNDYVDKGWGHWGRSSSVAPDPTQITIDMWPYMNDYRPGDLYRAGEMELGSGRPAYLFSSTDAEIVNRHFRWMRKYDIDGAYLQRFVTRNNSGYYGASEFVLNNVMEAASKQGRVWALEYDVSSLDNDSNPFEVISNDWNWLVNEVGILDDPRYLHEGGKPVLFIWGFSVNDRDFTLEQADEILDWFRQQDLYLIGGVNWFWENNTDWYEHYKKYDQLLGWMERDEADLVRQRQLLESWGVKILPHAWPGFSWHNLKQFAPFAQYTDRNDGAFYWQRLYNAISSGGDQVFLGMFDEYDEGTAIMPMSDDPPLPHSEWGHYLTNEGLDPFWYLRLSGAASEVLNGHRPLSSALPLESELTPPAYGGGDATVYMVNSIREEGLFHPQPADGQTLATFVGNHEGRINAASNSFYFNIDDALCFAVAIGQRATIELEYYDILAGIEISLQYDNGADPYRSHDKIVTTPGIGGWKNIRWNLEDGYFANRQNGGADFRISISSGSELIVRRASLFFPETVKSSDVPPLLMEVERLEWPVREDATGWRLYQSPTLQPESWSEVQGPFLFSEDSMEFTVPTAPTSFFRLAKDRRY